MAGGIGNLKIALVLAAWTALGTLAAPAGAAVMQYATRAAFNAAFPGLPVEDFEEARVPASSSATMSGPLDINTNNLIFHPNEILNGLRVNVPNTVSNPANMFVSGPGFATYVSHAISFNSATTPAPQITVDLYNGGVPSIGLDVTSNPNGNSVTVTALSGVTILGSFLVANAQGAGTFFGISSDAQPITQLQFTNGNFYGVDNIALAVPEPAALIASVTFAATIILTRRRPR
jgi:hypothetical protein